MRKHATEDVFEPERTLCGLGVAAVKVDNCDPTCKRCRRVIRSRCAAHNSSRCKGCPRIGA
jgi:hypothetical protein